MLKWLSFGLVIILVLWLSTKIIDFVFPPNSNNKKGKLICI